MGLFSRGPQLPGWVRAQVPDRPLAAAAVRTGGWLLGTREELRLVTEDAGVVVDLRWERVHRADWDADSTTLHVEQVEAYGEPVRPLSFELEDPAQLLQLIRERVTASVLVQRRVLVEKRRGLSVIGRRAPSGRGEVIWAYELDAGVDPADPLVMAAAELGLREAQESLGLG
jgi:hypothetical protein